MGNSISSVIAQLVLKDLKESIIANGDILLPFFYCYVDDCITAIPKDHQEKIKELFNSYNDKLQFPIEIKHENKINFLDLTLFNQKYKMKSMWYTKQTWSSNYLHFNSNQSNCLKKTVFIGLIDQAISKI